MVRQTIAIDIDDVLADSAAGFVAFSNAMWGTNLRPEDYDEHWAQVWQVENDEVERRATAFHESGVLRRYKSVDTALPVLRRLGKDYDLRIVTSRRLQTRQDTIDWVHEHYPGIFSDDTIHFAGIWDTIDDQSIHQTKGEVIGGIGAHFLIDDQLKHCRAVADSGRTALLFGNYTWNQTDTLADTINRVADWSAVEEYFYGQ